MSTFLLYTLFLFFPDTNTVIYDFSVNDFEYYLILSFYEEIVLIFVDEFRSSVMDGLLFMDCHLDHRKSDFVTFSVPSNDTGRTGV